MKIALIEMDAGTYTEGYTRVHCAPFALSHFAAYAILALSWYANSLAFNLSLVLSRTHSFVSSFYYDVLVAVAVDDAIKFAIF